MESRKHPIPAPEQQQRAGSGASVVLDPPETGGIEAESRKLPSSQYKGVVPQPNGRWGAQIYEKHQRVWLGTFNEEAEAARAYDVAAQRFRGRDAITNFKPLSESDDAEATDLTFLHSRSKAEIVDMLRKHTYQCELEQNRRSYATQCTHGGRVGVVRKTPGALGAEREPLFEKSVTPSDVGKLNRLVIPKQHAEKHFPLQICSSAAGKGVLLNFEDGSGKVWRFRYSYWNSSQSYVLTKGWSRFVKEKGLKAGDVVCFQRSTSPEQQLYIDRRTQAMVLPAQLVTPAPVFRLFGVNISTLPVAIENVEIVRVTGLGVCGWNGKRAREIELPSPTAQLFKKQCEQAL